ncbi:hypothetical protein [Methylobacterium sp. Leaf118]|uniref:hypothetical protein n=1 Tax=Methylobacterium sp. Leaf118 TaxID=2876562 RepID=UPI001E4CD8BD|nr:hypothetical protein [Methylobacterium sp. Leaf118]
MTARPTPARSTLRLVPRRPVRAACALSLVALEACSPVHAAEAATILLPWGDGLAALVQALAALATPMLAAAIAALIARIGGPLRLLVTDALVERLVRNATDYALNAVAGAVRGRTLSVTLGSAVIARAVQRALDEAPGWLVRAAGGGEGLAAKVFRALPLEAGATAANTLDPALARVLDPTHARTP